MTFEQLKKYAARLEKKEPCLNAELRARYETERARYIGPERGMTSRIARKLYVADRDFILSIPFNTSQVEF